jgi:acetyl esterase/lipase
VSVTDFAYGDGFRHKLDVYRPRGGARAPVIVFFYGGRWQSGGKGWYRPLAAALAARGYATVVPDYRLYPEVRFPEFLIDGAHAIRWTRDNIAAFDGDPRQLFVMGHSAGAYIAAMLALDPQWLGGVGLRPDRDVAGLIGLAGPYDFLPLKDPKLVDIFDGPDRAITQPISFADGAKPPALLITGAADFVVAPGNSSRLAARLRRSGNDATDLAYPRLGHFTILAGLVPLLSGLMPLMRDLRTFVARVGAHAPNSIPVLAEATHP